MGETLGPLYRADTRLRPHGASGPLSTTLDAFREYYRSSARAWERLALTRARVVHSRGRFGREVAAAVREILAEPCDHSRLARDVFRMRKKLEESAGPNDLRRGPGGLFDIEFLLQFLQLRHAPDHPETLKSNAWDALGALRKAGLLGDVAHAELVEAYEFRRTIEGRLRIVHNRPVGELPELARTCCDWPGA